MTGDEFMNKLAGGKIAWREGMREELRRLKREYEFAKQKSTADEFTFAAIYDEDLDQYKCMRCGTMMDNRSTFVDPSHICPECDFRFTTVTIQTHTYLSPTGDEKILDPAGA